MAYQRLELSVATPNSVRSFIVEHIENLSFVDIHTILRLPLPEYGLSAGCNFAIAHILMAVVSGISTTLFEPEVKDQRGRLFQDVLIDFFPWDAEPEDILPREIVAKILYQEFRNPLTHSLGYSTQRYRVSEDDIQYKVKRLASSDKQRGPDATWIEHLERSTERPKMSATLVVREDAKVLLVEGLYWGIRRLVERLTSDDERMKRVDNYLSRNS
jgi:hypothetical protein